MRDDDELTDAFEAFERARGRGRSVLEVEDERIAKGYPPDDALQIHGGDIEDEILRQLEREAELLRSKERSAEILAFPADKRRDGE